MDTNLNRTRLAFLARGINSGLADQLLSERHSIKSLSSLNYEALCALGIEGSIAREILAGRTPIPEKTIIKLLFDCKWVCCVCRSPTAPVIVHHIAPWADSRSHDASNLIVLCLNDHARAHSKGEIDQQLTPQKLKGLKSNWEEKVRADDISVIREAAQSAAEYWFFFNLLRLHDIAEHERINLKSLQHYRTALLAGIINKNGVLIPERMSSAYAYSGPNTQLRYWYARDLFFSVLDRISVTNLSDRLDISDVGSTVVKNDIVYVEGAFFFKQLNKNVRGPDQMVGGVRSANSVKIAFQFDRWYATSTSAGSVWLTGRKAVGCFCRVGDISREGGGILITCTVLAICKELPSLKNRDYLSSSVYSHMRSRAECDLNFDDEDEEWIEL